MADLPPRVTQEQWDALDAAGEQVITARLSRLQRMKRRNIEGSTMTNETTASQPKSIGDDAQCGPIQYLHNVCADVVPALLNCGRQRLADLLEGALRGLPVAPVAQASAFLSLADDDGFRLALCKYNVGELTEKDFIEFLDDHAKQAAQASATIQAAPDNMRIECHYYDIGPARKAFYEGVRAVGTRLEAIAKGWDGCNAHGIDSGKGADIGADLRKSFASIGAAPMVADPAGVRGLTRYDAPAIYPVGGYAPMTTAGDGEYVRFDDVIALAATVKAVPSEARLAKQVRADEWRAVAAYLESQQGLPPEEMKTVRLCATVVRKVAQSHLFDFAAPLADKTGGGES